MKTVQDNELCSRLRTNNIFTCSEKQKINMLTKYPNATGYAILEQNKKFEKMIKERSKKRKKKRKTKKSKGRKQKKRTGNKSKKKRKIKRSKSKKQRRKEITKER